ncbi:hypothetical protein U1Q18_052349, partial [Sarracenia purpurea var. burkii]
ERLVMHLLEAGFFSDFQFGFLPGRGAEKALIHHVTKIIDEMESGKLVTAVLRGCCERVDTVNHGLSLKLLGGCGLDGGFEMV